MPPVSENGLVGTLNNYKVQLTKNAKSVTKSVMVASSHEGKATELICEIAANFSQIGPSRSADDRHREDAAMVERISRNGGVKRVDGSLMVTPLHVVAAAGGGPKPIIQKLLTERW